MKIIAIEHNPPGIIAAGQFNELLLKNEAHRAWDLYQAGVIRELYFRADQHAAVLVLECDSLGEAQAVLNTLPLVQEKLIEFELIPLIAYPGFARLFSVESPSIH
jgi:muconolactone delta-isomerase